MKLGEYITERLDEGENQTMIEGLQNNLRYNLVDAVGNIPREDWEAEMSNRQKVADGQTLIWLEGRSEPSYSIQE